MDEYNQRLTDIKLAINEIIWRNCDPNMTLKEAEDRACRAFKAITDGGGVMVGQVG